MMPTANHTSSTIPAAVSCSDGDNTDCSRRAQAAPQEADITCDLMCLSITPRQRQPLPPNRLHRYPDPPPPGRRRPALQAAALTPRSQVLAATNGLMQVQKIALMIHCNSTRLQTAFTTLERIWIPLDLPLCAQLLAHCVRNQRADLAAKLHLWAREQEVRFSDHMFETLLDLVAPTGDQAVLQAINSNMRSWGVAPTTAQMAAMVRGHLAAGDWRRAVQWFQDIPRLTGQLAAASLHAALIDGLLDSLPTPHDLALPRVQTASASLSAMVHLPPSITTQRLLRRSREKVGLAWVTLGYPDREDALYKNF